MTVGPFDARIDPDLDPFLSLIVPMWAAQEQGRAALVPEVVQGRATGGVHGEHDVVLHRPPVPGELLQIWVDSRGSRPVRDNASVTLRYSMLDADEQLVAEQWWTTVWFGVTCDESGEPAPEHRFPEDARERPLGTFSVDVDEAMARRYAELSGDWAAHHFDVEGARRSGFERPFLHGLCTMTLCARAVVELAAAGDATRLRRVAVRFATPTFLGEALDVQLYDAGPLGIAFEAESAGATVISHGRAELR